MSVIHAACVPKIIVSASVVLIIKAWPSCARASTAIRAPNRPCTFVQFIHCQRYYNISWSVYCAGDARWLRVRVENLKNGWSPRDASTLRPCGRPCTQGRTDNIARTRKNRQQCVTPNAWPISLNVLHALVWVQQPAHLAGRDAARSERSRIRVPVALIIVLAHPKGALNVALLADLLIYVNSREERIYGSPLRGV